MSLPCALALEAATAQLSLAACRGGRLEVLDLQPAREHTGRIVEHATQLLEAVGGDFATLDFVAFGCGPGSFTGVRVAAAVVQALAFAHDLPVCRVSSLAVLAAGAGRVLGPGCYGICQDARMGQAYVALYDVAEAPRPVVADALADPGTLRFDGDQPFVALGDGWTAFPDVLARHRQRVTRVAGDLLPSARDLLSMATAQYRAGATVSAELALPEYLGQAPARPS
ncbi:MAG: tRNA (adenosine(37)-N6)-threonylcarbamoyltransferase complex dimerization subunit type 1 TsaB [Gammaproteobacteria bacterium]|nr:tRNA (adenosine(37)-N6)-threonylcarbamoyltransferase complex dimerization subunit type 1 TsaB [Gammaproteobacteria bacterium]